MLLRLRMYNNLESDELSALIREYRSDEPRFLIVCLDNRKALAVTSLHVDLYLYLCIGLNRLPASVSSFVDQTSSAGIILHSFPSRLVPPCHGPALVRPRLLIDDIAAKLAADFGCWEVCCVGRSGRQLLQSYSGRQRVKKLDSSATWTEIVWRCLLSDWPFQFTR